MARVKWNARIVERNLPFSQSRNIVNIRFAGVDSWQNVKLLKGDWFHVMLRCPSLLSILSLLLVWTTALLFFAWVYRGVDQLYGATECGLSTEQSPLSFGGFFAFSLQTSTTVGYGLPGNTNAFFENCPWIQIVIFAQLTFSMMFNAFLLAFVFSRIARAENRASQVIMSSTCCVRTEGDKWILEVRVFDTDAKYPIVESHVRLYARTKTNELIPLRIISPTDDTGAMLFLGLPCIVRHEIDVYSALHPPVNHKFRLPGSGLHLREADSRTGNIDQMVCPICAESYGDMYRLRTHVQLVQLIEETSGYPIEGSHRSLSLEDLSLPDLPSLQDVKASFPEELLVVVEGIDPLMSGTFQGLQSYKIEDVSWGGRFTDCLSGESSVVTMDFEKFHSVDIDDEMMASNGYKQD
jgi:hypothetical protein